MIRLALMTGFWLLMFWASSAIGKVDYRWTGKGHLYDERNQYFVTCRLTKEYHVEPFFGEDAVKCHYRCQDHKSESDEFVITTHSDHVCEKETVQPRGEFRDWRSK